MIHLAKELAGQFREVHLTGDWVSTTSLKTQLEDLTWQQATNRIGAHNTIAALAFHLNYYIAGIIQVLQGGPLDIHDRYSFDAPAIRSAEDWDLLRSKLWADAEQFAALVEAMPASDLHLPFADEKYGSNYRNINAMIQHIYYHLGQITLLKKLVIQPL
ncbi:DinB family protein [Niabella drilacis]|uniref:DinB superfamily protein n=1 Tax=Niabella drilacis (strain DSM 25811 / CCM 8410 / CCUG 62505 / LMG 26954 / E90) TaxID=1285928 RepID=A0A1G6R3U0_NIADE|nr:DinB family protein [Niabella drilacis]SDC99073.1 DinB superfamily protein [Niabella drilacis]